MQAAIAAVHSEAPSIEETDRAQIRGLYDVLDRIAPNPMVTLNRAVAVAMVEGPAAGLAAIDELAAPGTARRSPSPSPPSAPTSSSWRATRSRPARSTAAPPD